MVLAARSSSSSLQAVSMSVRSENRREKDVCGTEMRVVVRVVTCQIDQFGECGIGQSAYLTAKEKMIVICLAEAAAKTTLIVLSSLVKAKCKYEGSKTMAALAPFPSQCEKFV
jgi:hypothetical protein